MVPPVPTVVVAVAFAAAAYGAWLVARNRPADVALLVASGVVEATLVVQAVVGIVALAGTNRAVSAPLFIGYLLVSLLVVPAGLLWGLLEHSRWGPAVVAVACLVIPVLELRLQTVWSTGA